MDDTFYSWYKTQDADKTFEHLGVREIAFISFEAGRNSNLVEARVSPKTADNSNKIRWFMELALKMRETGYSDASIYSIDTDAWDEYRVDDELTPDQAITEEESNG